MKFFPALFLFTCLALQLPAQFCTADDRFTEVEYFTQAEIDFDIDLEYGQALDYQGNLDTLLLDAFYPDQGVDALSLRPAIVMIHGGGFLSGNKTNRRAECVALARRGFVAFSINYRLGWDTLDPSDQDYAIYRAHQDAHAAMRYVINQASTFGIDTNWVFIGGSSAGAIAAHKLIYASPAEWDSVVPGIEGVLGRLDTSSNNLTDTFDIKGIFNNWGGVYQGVNQASEMIPMVAFHGELDGTVRIDSGANGLVGSRTLHNALISNGICSELTVDLDGGHGVYPGQDGAVFRAARASCFFKSLFCNTCSDYYSTDSIPASCSVATSLDEPLAANYSVYPNPVQDRIQVAGLQGGETLVLYNASGQLIEAREEMGEISMAHLPSGLYILTVVGEEKRETFRLVKQ